MLPEKENTGQCARSPKQTNEITSAAEQGLAMLRLRQVHFPFPYLCLNGMILPTASLNCFILSQLLPYSIQNLSSSFVYIIEMNIDRTKVITVLVLCNTFCFKLMSCCIKHSKNFVEGPWCVLFYLTLVPSLKYQDYQTSSQLIFLLCELFLLQAFSFKLWIFMLLYSPNLSAAWF